MQTYEHTKKTGGLKPFLILALIVAGSVITSSAYSQVHINVGIGYERDFPGYTYYTYPAWNGHYRDRVYYAHYRPSFERDHRAYFAGRRFDHTRYERETHWHGGPGNRGHGGPGNRGRGGDHRH